ncbi:MAG: toxin-antitoxin system HicB family antitoxin [Actinomycetota bacterium]
MTEPAAGGAEDSTTARISLRLSDSLKAEIEIAAARDGVSTNSWITRALSRSVGGFRSRAGNRLTGFGRS